MNNANTNAEQNTTVVDNQSPEDGQLVDPVQPTDFDFVDPNTNRPVKLPIMVGETNVKSLIESVIAKSNKKAKDQFRLEIQNLQNDVTDYNSVKDKLETLELKNMSNEERQIRDIERQRQELTKAQNETSNTLKVKV